MAALPPINTPQAAINEVRRIGAELNRNALTPARKKWFCELFDLISTSQANAPDQARARRWREAYEEWERVYRAMRGDADRILPGQVPDCCARHRVAPETL